MNTLYLVLENGKIFKGKGFGKIEETIGELVFTTAMTGYNETITDPSYYGQIVVQTFPLMGNYGTISEDFESRKPFLKGYIARDICETPSNFRSEGTLSEYLNNNNIVGLSGIDTRQLTRILRESGTMNGKITSDISNIEKIIADLKEYSVRNAVKSVSSFEKEIYRPENPKKKVVLWDFGVKLNMVRELLKRDCEVVVVPCNTKAEDIIKLNPDGIMLSNGPGDPKENTEIIDELKKLNKQKIPTFGICLGHQILALSMGAQTEKLKYGHRGANHPAKDLNTNRVYITSQNHGYAVISESLPGNARCDFINLNDNSCEGVAYLDMPAFSVQFHPEACAGPHDSNYLFDKFIGLMER
ncbi:MAG: carbamoyl phosphate synthase small subunit [Eubacteriales bacterium]|nr:carbamoyl phosphate synthase small subunit [Eubacteriales bacterium]